MKSGDYVVDNFDLDIREHLLSGTNRGIYQLVQHQQMVTLLQKLN